MDLRNRTPAAAGALAAGLLVEACLMGPNDPLNLRVVGNLALDLERRLDALSHPEGEDDLIEAAQASADLATLAACNLPDLPPDGRPPAMAAVHLAAGATRALAALVEPTTGVPVETPHAENAIRDVRSAIWRADLAVRQIGETDRAPG